MKGIIYLESLRRAPPRSVALHRQGIPEGHKVTPQVERLLEKALSLYESLTEPRGLMAEISLPDFEDVFHGEGNNDLPAPLPEIVKKANGVALFAATIGEPVSRTIEQLFQQNDPATACLLDGIASERTEAAVDRLAGTYLDSLLEEGLADSGTRVLAYSPGYCGWHLTGQRKLFSFLNPERIGVRLSHTCLMSPIKSVSGVLVAGLPQIHNFENNFDFCLDCADWECRGRIASILEPLSTKG